MIEAVIVEGFGSGRGRTYMISRKLCRDNGKSVGYVRQKDIDEMRHSEHKR